MANNFLPHHASVQNSITLIDKTEHIAFFFLLFLHETQETWESRRKSSISIYLTEVCVIMGLPSAEHHVWSTLSF